MAADLTQSFVGKHVEKMVLAAAALIFVVSLVWFVFMREPQGRDLVQVEGLVEGVAARAYKPTIVDALTKEERVRLGIDKSVTTAAQFAQALNGLPATWDAVAKMVEGMPEIVVKEVIAEEVNPPQQILAVEDDPLLLAHQTKRLGPGCHPIHDAGEVSLPPRIRDIVEI